jgi:hypothetical protein
MSRGKKIALIVGGVLVLNGLVMRLIFGPPKTAEEHHPIPPATLTLHGGMKRAVNHGNDHEMFVYVETKSGPTVHVTKIASELDDQDCERKMGAPNQGIFQCRSLQFSSRTRDSERVQSYATAGPVHAERYVLTLIGAEGQDSTFVVHIDD